MPTGDLPTMASAMYASTAYSPLQFGATAAPFRGDECFDIYEPLTGMAKNANEFMRAFNHNPPKQEIAPMAIVTTPAARRIVQVFIADLNENITLEDQLIYKGEPKFTDLTDQELFFELDVKNMLTSHNEKRTKVVNKAVKDRTEYLEPAKIRDLKMTVVTIASF